MSLIDHVKALPSCIPALAAHCRHHSFSSRILLRLQSAAAKEPRLHQLPLHCRIASLIPIQRIAERRRALGILDLGHPSNEILVGHLLQLEQSNKVILLGRGGLVPSSCHVGHHGLLAVERRLVLGMSLLDGLLLEHASMHATSEGHFIGNLIW